MKTFKKSEDIFLEKAEERNRNNSSYKLELQILSYS